MNSGPSPSNSLCSATIRSSPSIAASFAPDGADLFRDVDADGTPGDAAATSNAAGCAELIHPVGQLVRHPLPIARPRRTAHRSAVDIREVHREAAVPATLAFRGTGGEKVLSVHRGAEAGRTDHRAVAAGQAALRDIVPTRMLQVRLQQLAHVVRAHMASLV